MFIRIRVLQEGQTTPIGQNVPDFGKRSLRRSELLLAPFWAGHFCSMLLNS